MKLHRILLGLAVLVFTAIGSVSGSTAHTIRRVNPDTRGPVTININFNGFGNGMTLTITNKLNVSGFSTGDFAGYYDEGFEGKVRGNSDTMLFVASNNNGDPALMYVLDLTNDTFTDWENTGGGQTEVSTGTFTCC